MTNKHINTSNLTDQEKKELARKNRNEYNRRWRAKNKDKVKEYQDRYFAKLSFDEEEQPE